MSDLKPIETAYNGYRFRSRLEARWAVWFDAMGIKYQYEAEGFDLGGLYYLPDFYLPQWEIYVEIKPSRALEPDEIEKIILLQEQANRRAVIIVGQPRPDDYLILVYLNRAGEWSVYGCEFAECRRGCGELWFLAKDRSWGSVIKSNPKCECTKDPVIVDYSLALQAAFNAASSARFEHGESPNPLTSEYQRIQRELSDYSKA